MKTRLGRRNISRSGQRLVERIVTRWKQEDARAAARASNSWGSLARRITAAHRATLAESGGDA